MNGQQTLAIRHHPCSIYASTRQTDPGWGSVQDPCSFQDQGLAGIGALCDVGTQPRTGVWPRLGAQPGLGLWLGFSWGQGSALWSTSSCSVSPTWLISTSLSKRSAGRPLAGLHQEEMLSPAQSLHYCPPDSGKERASPRKDGAHPLLPASFVHPPGLWPHGPGACWPTPLGCSSGHR